MRGVPRISAARSFPHPSRAPPHARPPAGPKIQEEAMRSDTQIQSDVLAELKWQPKVNAADIGVTVKDGIVTLTGSVPSFTERYEAEQAAKRVYGVKAVVNEIEVKLPGSTVRTDQDIAADAVRALTWNAWVPEDKIKVTVSKGWIRLEGEVDWQFQKEAAERAVRDII